MSAVLMPTQPIPGSGAKARRRVLVVSRGDMASVLGDTLLYRGDVERLFADTTAEALPMARIERPHLTLVDAADHEPALELVRALRSDPDTRATAIVVLTRTGLPWEEDAHRKAGANAVWAIPGDPLQWDARLAELLAVPPRRDVRIPVSVQVRAAAGQEPGASSEAQSLNLSLNGMLLESAAPLEVGTRLELSFSLPSDAAKLGVVGVVVRHASATEGRFRAGVKFLVLRGDASERIAAFVAAARPAARPGRAGEREQWESQLKASAARGAAVLRTVLDAVLAIDHHGRIVEFNGAAEATFGRRRAEVLGQRAVEILLPAGGRETYRAALRSFLSGVEHTQSRRIELVAARADGSNFPAEVSLTASRLDGRPYLTACVRDLSGLRRAEEALRSGARQFQGLFDGSIDAMAIADDEGRYVEVNRAACLLYGVERAALLGRWVGEAALGADLAASWCELRRSGAACGEFRLQRADGTLREVEFVATADFVPGSHLVVLRDATERHKLEAQLRQAQKMEAVGRLAGGIAHDFNNLLNVITAYAELLQRQRLDEERASAKAGAILRAAQRAAGLTRQLLAFSRKQVLQPRIFDLNAVVADTEQLLRRLIGEDVSLEAELAANLGSVKADPGQIEQVLMNLAVNARDAMPQGGRLRIQTANVDLDEAFVHDHVGSRPGAYVRLRMSDDGIGMDEETRRQAFEPFFTTKKLGEGTGLGLATVYGIVKQSDGYIWVESAPGAGASFDVYLPRVSSEPPATPEPEAEQPTRAGSGGETLLLVEDEPLLREAAREALEDAGYAVLDAGSGEEGLAVAREHEGGIDLVVTDMILPGMNGLELARALAAVRPETRTLFVSGYTDHPLLRRGLEQANFLQKPFGAAALETKVREVLEARPARAEAAALTA